MHFEKQALNDFQNEVFIQNCLPPSWFGTFLKFVFIGWIVCIAMLCILIMNLQELLKLLVDSETVMSIRDIINNQQS